MIRVVVLVVAALVACAHRPGPPTVRPAVLGETRTLRSEVLGEQRVINVYLPPGYAEGTTRYPVLYMTDGGMAEDFPHIVGAVDVSIKNARIRPVIVVGVENTERRRDLVGVTVDPEEQKAAPHAGGADRYRAFFRTELRPMIERTYRTTKEAAFVGESLGGLFAVETFLVEPTLFDSYIAADPSLQWNEQHLARAANAHLAAWQAGPRQLYLASSDATPIIDGVAVLVRALEIARPAGMTWTYEPMPHEHHDTIFPTAALHGIRQVFALPPAM